MPTAVTRYVNTASTAGGDGTTNATSGANRAYASLAAWNTAEAKDLVTADQTHTVICSGGQETLTTGISMSSWVTDATRFVTIKSDETRSPSTYADGYRLYTTSAINMLTLASYTILKNIRMQQENTSGSVQAISNVSSAVGVVIDSCWIRKTTSAGWWAAVFASANTSRTVKNCILQGAGGTSYGVNQAYVAGAVTNVFNCTITGFTGGAGLVRSGTTTFVVRNCAIFNNAADRSGDNVPTDIQYTASDDAITGTGNRDISPGAVESDDWNLAFVNYAAGDFRIKDSSSVLYNAGTDLSASGVTYDFLGTARPQFSTYDIGAFELLPVGAIITAPTPTTVANGQTSVVITGTSFGASQGSGMVSISPTSSSADANAVTQTVSSWSDTSITVNVVRGGLKYGTRYLFVKNGAGVWSTTGWSLTFTPQAGWQYVNIVTPAADTSVRVTSTPDIANGDQVAYGNVVGTGSVTLLDDGTFHADSGVTSFDFEVNDGSSWGTVATQTLSAIASAARAVVRGISRLTSRLVSRVLR